MLESRQQISIGYSLHYQQKSNHFPSLLKQCFSECIFLLSPQDSTSQEVNSEINPTVFKRKNRDTVKAVFWIIASIIVSFAIGQLG